MVLLIFATFNFNLDFDDTKIRVGQPHHKIDAATCFTSGYDCLLPYFLLPCPNAPDDCGNHNKYSPLIPHCHKHGKMIKIVALMGKIVRILAQASALRLATTLVTGILLINFFPLRLHYSSLTATLLNKHKMCAY